MTVFISPKPLNISVKRIIATTVEEFSIETKETFKEKEEENEGFDVIKAIQSAVHLVELKASYEKIDSFTKIFEGILDQCSIDRIKDVLKDKVADDVHFKHFPHSLIFTKSRSHYS